MTEPAPTAQQQQQTTEGAPAGTNDTAAAQIPAETQESTPIPFDDLNHKPCPNCTVGVMHMVTYDVESLHEVGQAVDKDTTSGGSAIRRCFHCEYSDSIALNPGPKYQAGA